MAVTGNCFRHKILALLLGLGMVLSGCASSNYSSEQLDQARTEFLALADETQAVLELRPNPTGDQFHNEYAPLNRAMVEHWGKLHSTYREPLPDDYGKALEELESLGFVEANTWFQMTGISLSRREALTPQSCPEAFKDREKALEDLRVLRGRIEALRT